MATPAEVGVTVIVQIAVYLMDYFLVLLFIFCHSVWHQAPEELGLDADDLVDEAPSMFESTPQQHGD